MQPSQSKKKIESADFWVWNRIMGILFAFGHLECFSLQRQV